LLPLEAHRGKEWFSPWNLQKKAALQTMTLKTHFGTVISRTAGEYICVLLCGDLLQQQQETDKIALGRFCSVGE
jgi:hypothetical protein